MKFCLFQDRCRFKQHDCAKTIDGLAATCTVEDHGGHLTWKDRVLFL